MFSLVSIVAKKIAKHFPMGTIVCYLKERECHHVQQLTSKAVRWDPCNIDTAIQWLNKHGSAVGICFHDNRFGILEVKSRRFQTSRRTETRLWIAQAVRQACAWASEIDGKQLALVK